MAKVQGEIGPARPGEWPAAFALALQHVASVVRPTRVANALTLLAAEELPADGILVARDWLGLVGVQVTIPLAGASGLFWLPQVRPGADEVAVADALVQAALAWLRSRGAKLATVILEPAQLAQAEPLFRQGFAHITGLQYFRYYLQDRPAFPPGAGATRLATFRLEPYRPSRPALFHQTLMRTYEGTLDCPELNDRRSVLEIIAGHQAQGRFHAERWQLAWLNDQPAGVLIANELFDDLGWDLSYVGVVPAMRRRGLGQALTTWALHAAQQAGAAQMILAVDVRNEPALAMYEALGFQPTERREVLLRFLVDG